MAIYNNDMSTSQNREGCTYECIASATDGLGWKKVEEMSIKLDYCVKKLFRKDSKSDVNASWEHSGCKSA